MELQYDGGGLDARRPADAAGRAEKLGDLLVQSQFEVRT